MPIALPAGLPAAEILRSEGVDILSGDKRGLDRRPLRVCLVNLMPNKVWTETQIARLLGAAPVPVELILCVPDAYHSKNTSADHLASFYRPWSHVREQCIDALIVTGAPVETLPFEEVTYRSDLCRIFDWVRSRSIHAFYICWAAQAALHHFHSIPKRLLREKMFGVFRHRVTTPHSCLMRGFPDEFAVPVSRHTEILAADLPDQLGLRVLAASPEAGLCLIEDRGNRSVYMFNHLEYDAETLGEEYLRDRQAGRPVSVPHGYFPGDDPQRTPTNIWRPWGELLFANWLDEVNRTAPLRATNDTLIQWALTSQRSLRSGTADHSALLISAAAE